MSAIRRIIHRTALGLARATGSAVSTGGLPSPAFDPLYATSDIFDDRLWGSPQARWSRYALLWAYFEGTPYDEVHPWAKAYRKAYGLSPHTRPVFNPAGRIGEFHASRIMGGQLDRDAGDGKTVRSALPILCDNQALRPAIADIWRWSAWQQEKALWTRHGAVLGDAVLTVEDDPVARRCYLRVRRPSTLTHFVPDAVGNCRGYRIDEFRPDPRPASFDGEYRPHVRYTEICEKVPGGVRYRTFLDGEPFDWHPAPDGLPYGFGRDAQAAWEAPYPFVPMVLAQHIHVGKGWGWGEYFAGLAKFREVDDLGSTTTDQARRILNSPRIINVAKPDPKTKNPGRPPDPLPDGTIDPSDAISARRGDVSVTWIDRENLKVFALVNDMDIPGVTAHDRDLRAEIEMQWPELTVDRPPASGDSSGRALRVARQRAEVKVAERRSIYDDAHVRAVMMAISMGAIQGYPFAAAFDPDSYDRGDLFFQVGPRPVFSVDPLDDIEEQKAFWDAAVAARTAGYPLPCYLEDAGWDQERIGKAVKLMEAEKQSQMDAQRLSGFQPGGNPPQAKGSTIFPETNRENQPA